MDTCAQATGPLTSFQKDIVQAVVVTYFPEISVLSALLLELSNQVAFVYVIDNTPAFDARVAEGLAKLNLGNVLLQRLGDNFGIAKALNVGIEKARVSGATHVLLCDQDSLPATDMVENLLDAYSKLVSRGEKVCAVGPAYVDRNTRIGFPFQAEVAGKLFYSLVKPDVQRPVVEVMTLITSGSLIGVEVFADVGLMREDFFIDHVDTEWCLRARSRGFQIFGSCRAQLMHCLGDEAIRVWFFGWREHNGYSPTRLYYRFRNFLLLCRLPYVPLLWAFRSSRYWLFSLYAHCFFAQNRGLNARAIARGLWDGILGRNGPLQGA